MKSQKLERRAALNARGAFASARNGPVVEAMERHASLAGNNLRTLQEESLKFMTRRFEENTKTAQELGACKSWPEVFAVQQRWFADMTRAYGEEWMRCSELMTSALHGNPPDTTDEPRQRVKE